MIIFVIGPAASGKSTFIKNNYPDAVVVDLFKFQQNRNIFYSIWDTYVDCKEDLINKVKEFGNEKDIVLEHTLLLSKRRGMYIDAVREVSNQPIDIYLIKPSEEEFIKRRINRGLTSSVDICMEEMNMLETPTPEDGFRHAYIVGNDNIPQQLF